MATASELYAVKDICGTECQAINRAFVLCKQGDRNPESCLDKGAAVTECFDAQIARVKAKAADEFAAYTKCLYFGHNNFEKCRREKSAFEAAMRT